MSKQEKRSYSPQGGPGPGHSRPDKFPDTKPPRDYPPVKLDPPKTEPKK